LTVRNPLAGADGSTQSMGCATTYEKMLNSARYWTLWRRPPKIYWFRHFREEYFLIIYPLQKLLIFKTASHQLPSKIISIAEISAKSLTDRFQRGIAGYEDLQQTILYYPIQEDCSTYYYRREVTRHFPE